MRRARPFARRAATPGIGALTPLNIITSATVAGWWRSDLMCTGALWENQANIGGGTGWTQGTGGAQPTYLASDAVFNGRPSLEWDGVDDNMVSTITAPAPGTTNRFYWVIADNISFGAGTSALISGFGGTAHIVFRAGADAANQLTVNNGAALQGTANFTVGTARLVQVGLTNSVADFIKIGVSNATGVSALNNSAASMVLGAYTGAAGYARVKISEVLITNGIPSAPDRAALESYAVGLYGTNVTA
jgi:hypothetical protein